MECDVPRTGGGLCNVKWPGLGGRLGAGVNPGEQKKECGGSACLSPREAPRRGRRLFRLLKRKQAGLVNTGEAALQCRTSGGKLRGKMIIAPPNEREGWSSQNTNLSRSHSVCCFWLKAVIPAIRQWLFPNTFPGMLRFPRRLTFVGHDLNFAAKT